MKVLLDWRLNRSLRDRCRSAELQRLRRCRHATQRVVLRSSKRLQRALYIKGSKQHKLLHELSEWLTLQGAQGINNVICIEQPSGERGLVATGEFIKGDVLFCLPLECAICVWPDNDIEQDFQDAPSSVRLAVSLLRHFADAELTAPGAKPPPGPDGPPAPQAQGLRLPHAPIPPHSGPGEPSPAAADRSSCGRAHGWAVPYLRSLPHHPPAMLMEPYEAADLAAFEYPPLERALVSYRNLVAEHYGRCGGARGLGGASLEQFIWALAIVGSRCLGASLLMMALLSAGRGGGGGKNGGRVSYCAGSSNDSGSGSCSAATAEEAAAQNSTQLYSAPVAPPLLNMMMTLFQMASSGGDGGSNCGEVSYAGGGGAAVASTASPALTGGQLRLLVPWLDLINHGGVRHTGDRTTAGAFQQLATEANVRWELRPPSSLDPEPGTTLDRDSDPDLADDGRSSAGGWEFDGISSGGGGQGPLAVKKDPKTKKRDGIGGSSSGSSGINGITISSGWRIAVVATSDLAVGQELLLCYDGTAFNDTFALHYGFVPQLNPYDDVQLYDSLAAAVAWYHSEMLRDAAAETAAAAAPACPSFGLGLLAQQLTPLHVEQLTNLYGRASGATAAAAVTTAANAAVKSTEATVAATATPPEDVVIPDLDAPIKMGPRGRLCPRLEAAFRSLAQAQAQGVSVLQDGGALETADPGPWSYSATPSSYTVAVARRCVQLLQPRAPLLADLAMLQQDDDRRRQQQQRQQREQECQGHDEERGRGRPPQRHLGSDDGWPGSLAAAFEAAEAAPPPWRSLLLHYSEALLAQGPELRALAGLALPAVQAAVLESEELVEKKEDIPVGQWAPAAPRVPHQALRPCDGKGSSGGGGVDGGGSSAAAAPSLTRLQRLALEYRTSKKMILWDYLLAHLPPPQPQPRSQPQL